jgi:septal ring factor EnvC (AmiA/AmiB activator)
VSTHSRTTPSRTTILAALVLIAGAVPSFAKAPPVEQLAVARAAIDRAEQAQAGQFAQVELKQARDKLAAAQAAADKRKKDIAARLADEANLEAQLAEATARAKQQEQLVAQMESNLQALRDEAQRNRPAQ